MSHRAECDQPLSSPQGRSGHCRPGVDRCRVLSCRATEPTACCIPPTDQVPAEQVVKIYKISTGRSIQIDNNVLTNRAIFPYLYYNSP